MGAKLNLNKFIENSVDWQAGAGEKTLSINKRQLIRLLRCFQAALQHPRGLLVPPAPADRRIRGFEIIDGTGGVTERDQISQRFFVATIRPVTKSSAATAPVGKFVQAGLLRESAQATQHAGVQRPDAFGDLVDRVEEVRVMFLEGLVQREAAGTFDIPVGVVGERHQGVGIGQQQVEGSRNRETEPVFGSAETEVFMGRKRFGDRETQPRGGKAERGRPAGKAIGGTVSPPRSKQKLGG